MLETKLNIAQGISNVLTKYNIKCTRKIKGVILPRMNLVLS